MQIDIKLFILSIDTLLCIIQHSYVTIEIDYISILTEREQYQIL